MNYLVYTRGPRGPFPEIWRNGLDYGLNNWKQPYVIASRDITAEEAALSIDELAKKYPLEGMYA